MKRIFFYPLLLLLAYSCNSSSKSVSVGKGTLRGELPGLGGSKMYVPDRPLGMVAIPGGSFVLGQSDADYAFSAETAPLRTVTVSAFYMDEAETTNKRYRAFVHYVRDSIVRSLLAEKAGEPTGTTDKKVSGIESYAYQAPKDGKNTAYKDYITSLGDRDGYNSVIKKLNWKVPLYWNTSQYPDQTYAEVLESMYYTPEERVNGERLIDVRKLIFAYSWEDKALAKKKDRSRTFIKSESVSIYPDTTVWLRDFNYSYNEPMFEQYFWHKAFDDYPVVGVNWQQAKAFCAYLSKMKADYNGSLKKKKEKPFPFRLPTESEWEYAARGGLENAPYPWGGNYITDDKGCYLANFKPTRGNYIEDPEKGYLYTSKVRSFKENGYGLYDMAGNVAEWTNSPYEKDSYIMSSTINPYLPDNANPKKVVRGGSWKDVGYMLMVGARDWEDKDSARSYIGFRTVQTLPDNAKVNFKKNRITKK